MSSDIIERVRRLLALSQSSNVHEAASAAAKAQELIAKHQLDMVELAAAENAPDEPIDAGDLWRMGKRREPWRMALAGALAESNNCQTYTQRGPTLVLRIIGKARDASVVRYMLAYLTNEIDRLLAVELRARDAEWRKLGGRFNPGRTFHGSFRLGASLEIAKRIREAAERAKAECVASAGAIVRIDRDAQRLRDTVASAGLVPAPLAARYSHSGAFNAGQRAGAGVALGSGPALGAGARGVLR